MGWDYRLASRALRKLKSFPREDRRRIFKTLEEMRLNPFAGDIKLMQGEESLYRRRVGNYRIYFRPNLSAKILDIPEIERKQSH